jgi:hypothetical protein
LSVALGLLPKVNVVDEVPGRHFVLGFGVLLLNQASTSKATAQVTLVTSEFRGRVSFSGGRQMKKLLIPTAAAVISMAMLAACSKPASQTAADAGAATKDAAATAADTTANSAANVAAPGGAVSPPSANGAINTDANKNSSDLAAASNSFTEAEAKGHFENAGYAEVTNLEKTPDGLWTAKAKKGGKPVDVALDFKGAVTAK